MAKKGGYVEVGVIESAAHKESEGLTVADVASYNEFGTETIPERSFMRSTLRKEKSNIKALNKKLLRKITKGKLSTKKGLGLLGQFLSAKISKKIVSIKTPPNKPETIKRKGSSNPLVDTGQMKNSMNYKVYDGKLR